MSCGGGTVIVIIDNRSTDNLIPAKALTALKLKVSKHAHPCQLGILDASEQEKQLLSTTLVKFYCPWENLTQRRWCVM